MERNIQLGDGSVPDRWKEIRPLSSLTLSTEGEKLIKHYEGCKLKAYKDAKGIWTIGYGNTFYENGNPVKEGDTITQQRAEELFRLITPKFEATVKEKITVDLSQHQFDALVSFCYNAGTSYKLGNVWRDYQIWDKVNKGVNGQEMINYWSTLAVTSGGVKLKGLENRRKSESHLFVKGELKFFN